MQAALLAFICLFSLLKAEEDQLLIIFGSSGYVLHKVIDFANDHGFNYIKIHSYEFHGFDHQIGAIYTESQGKEKLFELTDDFAHISFFCYTKCPDGASIDVAKYRYLLGNR